MKKIIPTAPFSLCLEVVYNNLQYLEVKLTHCKYILEEKAVTSTRENKSSSGKLLKVETRFKTVGIYWEWKH